MWYRRVCINSKETCLYRSKKMTPINTANLVAKPHAGVESISACSPPDNSDSILLKYRLLCKGFAPRWHQYIMMRCVSQLTLQWIISATWPEVYSPVSQCLVGNLNPTGCRLCQILIYLPPLVHTIHDFWKRVCWHISRTRARNTGV